MKRNPQRVIAVIMCVASFAVVGACGGDSAASDTTSTSDSTSPASPSINVTGQWARTSPMATDMGAAYLTITSDTDDKLLSAEVDMSVAMMTQIHETVMGDDGAMKMQEVDSITVRAGTPTELKPGGYHVMLMQLKNPLETGTTISLTLTFAKAGEVTVEVPVLEEAP